MKVDEEDILHVVAKWTGIPFKRMEQGETQRLLAVETEMGKSSLASARRFPPSARPCAVPAPI